MMSMVRGGGGQDRSCCLEELIVVLYDIGAILERSALARIGHAAEQVTSLPPA
jgi:hypothetical protein